MNGSVNCEKGFSIKVFWSEIPSTYSQLQIGFSLIAICSLLFLILTVCICFWTKNKFRMGSLLSFFQSFLAILIGCASIQIFLWFSILAFSIANKFSFLQTENLIKIEFKFYKTMVAATYKLVLITQLLEMWSK